MPGHLWLFLRRVTVLCISSMEELSYSEREDADDQAGHFSENHNPVSAQCILMKWRELSPPGSFLCYFTPSAEQREAGYCGGKCGEDVEKSPCKPTNARGGRRG